MSNLAAQTGASLFQHAHAAPYPACFSHSLDDPRWTYNKSEHQSSQALTSNDAITHLIAESTPSDGYWDIVDIVSGFSRWQIDRDVLKRGRLARVGKLHNAVRLAEEDMLWLSKRNAMGQSPVHRNTSKSESKSESIGLGEMTSRNARSAMIALVPTPSSIEMYSRKIYSMATALMRMPLVSVPVVTSDNFSD
jgi:hypothetical protein